MLVSLYAGYREVVLACLPVGLSVYLVLVKEVIQCVQTSATAYRGVIIRDNIKRSR